MQKNVQNCTTDTNASLDVKMGKIIWGKIALSKWGWGKC